MRDFARAALPAQLIAFCRVPRSRRCRRWCAARKTDSACRKDVTGFVLPLAVSMFKFAAPVSWTFGTLFVAWFYRVDLGLAAYATIAFAAIFLGFVSPGVPARRLPDARAALPVAWPAGRRHRLLIAVDAIPDLFATVLNASGDLAATVPGGGTEQHR